MSGKKLHRLHPPSQTMVKLLLCGQVDGQWSLVWERARKLNASAKGAAFDALICVGRVLPFPSDYISGNAQVPVPTYILPAFEDLDKYESDPEQAPIVQKIREAAAVDGAASVEVLPNCFLLAKRGVASVAGLQVAFLAGVDVSIATAETSHSLFFSNEDVSALLTQVEKTSATIDFFFSAQYPAHFQHLVADQQVPGELKSAVTSSSLAKVLKQLAPRYHITSAARESDSGVFYQRLPYVTECTKTGRKQLTRLIGLCGVSSSKDKTKKYLHALQVVPSAEQGNEPVDIPAGTTQNPYIQAEAQQQRRINHDEPHTKRQRVDGKSGGLSADQIAALTAQSNSGGQFFYDQKIAARGQHPGALRPQDQRRGQQNRPPPVPERTECWFCLATPSVERHLIVSIGQEAYLAMPKGAINGDHVLIVPIAHEASTTKLSESTLKEIERFKTALRTYFDAQDKHMIVFDRNILTIGATHCHLQVLGIPKAKSGSAKQVFLDEGDKYNVKFEELTAGDDVRELTAGKPYFYVELPDAEGRTVRLLNFVEAKQYMQFGRHAAACVLGVPRRANWKFCVVPKHEEEAMTATFKKQWKPFDFTTEYDE